MSDFFFKLSFLCIVSLGYVVQFVYAKHVGCARSKRRVVLRESMTTSRREMRIDRYALQADRNKLHTIKQY